VWTFAPRLCVDPKIVAFRSAKGRYASHSQKSEHSRLGQVSRPFAERKATMRHDAIHLHMACLDVRGEPVHKLSSRPLSPFAPRKGVTLVTLRKANIPVWGKSLALSRSERRPCAMTPFISIWPALTFAERTSTLIERRHFKKAGWDDGSIDSGSVGVDVATKSARMRLNFYQAA